MNLSNILANPNNTHSIRMEYSWNGISGYQYSGLGCNIAERSTILCNNAILTSLAFSHGGTFPHKDLVQFLIKSLQN